MNQHQYEHNQQAQQSQFLSFLNDNLGLPAHVEPDDVYLNVITFGHQQACDDFFLWHKLTVDIT